MTNYLVRDFNCLEAVYGIIRLENKEDWENAKKYVDECREKDGRNFEADSELIEEYFQKNNIEYEWIDFEEELYL